MNLTHDNYFSLPADREFFSVHQYAAFCECQARETARLRGEYEEADKDVFAIGRYVEAALQSPETAAAYRLEHATELNNAPTLARLKEVGIAVTGKKDDALAEHPEWYAHGEPKADALMADAMIAAVQRCPDAVALLSGEPQVILTGEINGFPFKGCLDVLHPELGLLVDLKTVGSVADQYTRPDAGGRGFWVPWYEVHNYWKQMGAYRELLRQMTGETYTPVLLAVSKEKDEKGEPCPRVRAVEMSDVWRLSQEVELGFPRLAEFARYKSGEETPEPCAAPCGWCRRHDTELVYETAVSSPVNTLQARHADLTQISVGDPLAARARRKMVERAEEGNTYNVQ